MHMRRAVSAKVVGGGLLLLGLTGCVIYDALNPPEARYAFSHARHVNDEGLACEDCHVEPEGGGKPSLPMLAQCNLCHADADADKPPEQRIEQLFDGTRFKAARRGAVGEEVIFPHGAHTTKGLECSACHAGIENNTDVLALPKAQMASCTTCHEARSAPNECATCHTTLRQDVAPRSHDQIWLRGHGEIVCAGSERTVDDCSMCHQESSCISCHMEMPPQNHTDYWRRRAHGISASLDRASCATCHRDDSCVRCHSESRPMNHTGTWGSPQSSHCTSCHFPLQSEGCAVCHKGTPSHSQAAPKPPDHSPGMDCRMCHGAGQPLPHVDNGDNCNLCHH